MEYASKGVSGTALGLGIAGTALGVLDGLGGLTGLLGINRQPQTEGDRPVTRYELGLIQQINAKNDEIAGLRGMQYTDHAIAGVQAQIGAQTAVNATVAANLNCLQTQLAQLQGMTKIVIPNANVSPGWGGVAIEPVFAVEAAKLATTTATPAATTTGN